MTKSWRPAWGAAQPDVMLQNKCLAFEMTQNFYVRWSGDSFVRSGFLNPWHDWHFGQDNSLWCGLSYVSWDVKLPWHTPFPIWNQSVVPCPVLTVASWPAYRFLRRQVRWSAIPISWRIVHTVKGFGVINKAEINVFFWNSLAFLMIH